MKMEIEKTRAHGAGPHCGPWFWPADPAQLRMCPTVRRGTRGTGCARDAHAVARWSAARWCSAGDKVLPASTGGSSWRRRAR
jgi:hypothetical protein